MRTTTILSAFALGAGLLAGGVVPAPAFAEDNRPARVSERQWLSIPQIHDKLDCRRLSQHREDRTRSRRL